MVIQAYAPTSNSEDAEDERFYEDLQDLLESESEVVQSCPTLCDPVDCSLPDSSVHGILQEIFLTQGLNPSFCLSRRILYH